jgi:nucleotide-binding universal stress UspA family protein
MSVPILIPLDGTEQALVALPVAKRLAELYDATLHVVHVTREVTPPADVLDRIGITGAELRGSVLETREGDPDAGIVEAAEELKPAFVVMSTHSVAPIGERCVGATALAVLKGAPCPVVLVRPERGVAPFTLRRILLPHDGTPITSAAIGPAAELARKAGAELHVLHVASPGSLPPEESGALISPRYTDQPQHEWPAWAQEFIERVASVTPLHEIQIRLSLAHGVPGDEIVRFAREHASDLVVLAWHGEWEGVHAATVKAALASGAPPAMIIRTTPAR